MSKAIKKFNGLNGTIGIDEVQKLADLAKQEGQIHFYNRLTAGLEEAKKHNAVQFNPGRLALEEIPSCYLPGIDPIPSYITADEFTGLNKAVSPDDIYQYITDLMINTIKKVGNLPWQRSWKKTAFSDGDQAINFESKKGYRGINFFLLNFEVKTDEKGEKYLAPRNFENPYFLTFNQIEKFKGKLNKGAKGTRVVYFTQMYSHSETQDDGSKLEYFTYNKKKFLAWIIANQDKLKILKRSGWTAERLANSYIPILKYYNVFSAEDITGIDWGQLPKNDNADKSDAEKIEIAEAILKAMPNPPKINFGGNQPAYYPGTDSILIPTIDKFNSEQEYYSTMYHELVHSTGHRKRLSRPGITLGRLATKLDYAKEELVAEMGAVFLCAESGILFFIIDNSATYLRGWNSRLVKSMEEDNRFYFRAASAAQAAADYMLDRDKNGIPAYTKKLGSSTPKKEVAAVPAEKEVLPKESKKENHQFKKEQTVQFSKRWGSVKPGAEGIIKELRKSVHGDPMYKVWLSKGKDGIFPETVLQLPKKKLTKKELEATNPAPKAIKPKSISVASAIDDILSLDKYKGISKIQANILYKYFKNDIDNMEFDDYGDSVKYYDITGFENGNMKKETNFHILMPDYDDKGALCLTKAGRELVASIKNRVESKRNQKQNYALFDGLNSYVPEDHTGIKLKCPTIEPKPIEDGQGYSGEKPRPLISGKPLKASDIANMDFEVLPLDEGWQNLFQTAPKNMRIAVWAKPKNGKTAACCNFASYLTKFGPILYNFADQGINLSTKNLIEISGMDKKPNAFITTTDKLEVLAKEIESTGAHHVVIDMINQYIDQGVTPHIFRKEILQRFPDVGFTLVMEVTKAGDFKGDQAWTHLVDQLVIIENYIMDTKGRYGNGEKITWEEGAQKYAPQRYAEIKENEAAASPEPEILASTPESEEVFDFNVY